MVLNLYELSPAHIRWALRRLYWGLPREFLVLEIGSGGNPCPRSDVLVDYAYQEHEGSRILITDRPLILCPAESLPFPDKTFDFAITIHTLEHSADPRAFLREVERVSKGGYIETPSPINEILYPYKFHRSFVWADESVLNVKMKKTWDDPLPDSSREMIALFAQSNDFISFYRKNPKIFNTSFYWRDGFDFDVFDDDLPESWPKIFEYVQHSHHQRGFSIKGALRGLLPNLIRHVMGYASRKIDVSTVLRCARCGDNDFSRRDDEESEFTLTCNGCGSVIRCKQNIFESDDFAGSMQS